MIGTFKENSSFKKKKKSIVLIRYHFSIESRFFLTFLELGPCCLCNNIIDFRNKFYFLIANMRFCRNLKLGVFSEYLVEMCGMLLFSL